MEVRHKGELYVIGSLLLLVIGYLLVSALWPWKQTSTFLEDGKPVVGLKMKVIIANSAELNGKVFQTNQDGQIIIPRPTAKGDALIT